MGQPIGDNFSVYTNEKGEFSGNMVPGLTYLVGITDTRVACDPVAHKFELDEPDSLSIELPTYDSTPVKVTLKDKKGRVVSNGLISYELPKITMVDGMGRCHLAVRQGRRMTKDGSIIFGSAKGKIKLAAQVGSWRKEKEFSVKQGQPIHWELECPEAGPRFVNGTVSLSDEVDEDCLLYTSDAADE